MLTNYDSICVICGRPKEHTHHLVFGRGLRPLADIDDLTAPVCASCHKKIHEEGMAEIMSKMIGQMQWEKDFLLSCVDTDAQLELSMYARDKFRERYGRSYL